MGYLQELDSAFRERLNDILAHQAAGRSVAAEVEAFVRFAKEEALESYKNGLDGATLRVDKAEGKLTSKFARKKP